ncbi:MAG: DUF3099 domain-containing protein [Corynebacteriales bacterium]|nr:DUF3099 domain-containing protein [Mycobacteriales bacterium]
MAFSLRWPTAKTGERDAWSQQAPRVRRGFSSFDPAFLAERRERAALIHRFLAVMAQAGNPGSHRLFGSTVKQLTGQSAERYWSVATVDQHGHHREFMVMADGRHNWGDEIAASDRPRSAQDEVTPSQLRRLLAEILEQSGLSWESPAAHWYPNAQGGHFGARAPAATGPELTPAQELHRREVRYGTLMAVRIGFLILAAVVIMADVPGATLWMLLCIGAAMLLPWIAVMIANERFRHVPVHRHKT